MTEKIMALGFFDGVHRGHAALLRRAAALAAARGLRSAAMSFTTHPSALLHGESLPLLSGVAERRQLMQSVGGVDEALFLPFDRRMQSLPWERFLEELTEQQQVRGYVAGYDYRFGRSGEGDGEKLRRWCRERGLLAEVVPAVELDGVVVSSTHIRALLEWGELEEALRFLGHPYLLCTAGGSSPLRWGEGRLALRPGAYQAHVPLPGGEDRGGVRVEVTPRGVVLPFAAPEGELALAFTGRAHKE